MSYQTIVVHLDRSPRCDARVELALRLAAGQGGRLVGIAPAGRPDVVASVSSAVPDRVECTLLSAAYLRQCAEEATHRFDRRCQAVGEQAWESRVADDDAVGAVVRHARCSDLVVIGQTDPGARLEDVAADLPQQVLLQSGAPVLIVPRAGAFAEIGRRVMVAWNDSLQAARALRDALPLLRRSQRVVLLEVDEGRRPLPAGCHDLPIGWLASHGIAAESRIEAATTQGGIGETLLSRAADLDADLVVMGGYAHGRAREWVLGGATRHLLASMTVPTLMSH